jgi:hypothetical protein
MLKLKMNHWMCCLLLFLIAIPLQAQSNRQLDEIKPYLDSNTAMVAWTDASKLDINAVFIELNKLGDQLPVEQQAFVKMIHKSLLDAGVTQVYAFASAEKLESSLPPDFAMHCPSSEGRASVRGLLKLIPNTTVDEAGDLLLVSCDGQSISSSKSIISDHLNAALQTDSPHGLAFSFPPQAAKKFQNEFEQNQFMEKSLSAVLKSIVQSSWMRIAGTSADNIQLKAECHDPEQAVALKNNIDTFIAQVNDGLTGGSVAQLLPVANGTSVELQNRSIEQLLGLLKALKSGSTAEALVVNSLRQVTLGVIAYESEFNAFPPQCVVDDNGRRLLSWRVLILPQLGHEELYKQFKLDERWDSTHNLPLADQIPNVYSAKLSDPRLTTMVAPLAPQSIFGRKGSPISYRDIVDDTFHTILLVSTGADRAVIWTKPDDMELANDRQLEDFLGQKKPARWVSMADGSVRRMQDLPSDQLAALLTINGSEVIDPKVLVVK